MTRPPGEEGDHLMRVTETFAHVLAQSLENHVNDGSIGGKIGFEQAYMMTARPEVGKLLYFKKRDLYAWHPIKMTGKYWKVNTKSMVKN